MKKYSLLILGSVLVLGGCADMTVDEIQQPKRIEPANTPDMLADAGVPMNNPGPDTVAETFDYAKTRYFGNRADVFALLASERSFDRSQNAERILSEGGGWGNYFELPNVPGEQEAPRLLPTPRWRLAGVMFSNGVIALLEVQTSMGIKYFDLYPGATVEFDGQQWFVVSIHRGENGQPDYAIMRRVGGPFQEVVVPIAERGFASAGGTGGGGGDNGSGRQPPGAGAGGGNNNADSQGIRD